MFSRYIPKFIKAFLRRNFSWEKRDLKIRQKDNPFYNDPDIYSYKGSRYTLGIIVDDSQYHKFYIEACRKLEVSYKLINIIKENWITIINESGCDAFLVWPSSRNTIIKGLFDDRLGFMVKCSDKLIFPSLEECLIYENKLRMAYWLQFHALPHPRTWIFYYKDEAQQFAQKCSLPIVFKSSLGATASGVKIIKDRNQLFKLIGKLFGNGFLPRGHNKYDKQRGFIIFQEFLPSIREWRMVRIGDDYFGYEKLKQGEFHSGSHNISLEPPSEQLLYFLKDVTDKGGFRSMDVDVFVDINGKMYVNELQTVFGTSGLKEAVKAHPEKAICYRYQDGRWVQEDGYEAMVNGFATLRVLELIELLDDRNNK